MSMFFFPVRLQAAQEDVSKIQTQVDALTGKADRTENEDVSDPENSSETLQSGSEHVVESVQMKTEPVNMSSLSDNSSTVSLECE